MFSRACRAFLRCYAPVCCRTRRCFPSFWTARFRSPLLRLPPFLPRFSSPSSLPPPRLSSFSPPAVPLFLRFHLGVSLRVLGERRRNLLHVLCAQNPVRHFEDVALQLLAKGVEIDAADEDGNTPLHLAVLYANPAMIRFLVTRGAALDRANTAGKTPVQLATELNISEAVDAFAACARVPLPPAVPQVFLCSEKRLVVRWKRPISGEGVPEATFFEAEATDLGSGEKRSLGNQWSGECRRRRRREVMGSADDRKPDQ